MSAATMNATTAPLRHYKPYPSYKDSGVEWLGKIPAHWEESKVKFLGRYINGYAFKPDDWSVEGHPIIRIQNLTNAEATFNRFAGDLDHRYRVTRGDILISWSASLGLYVWSDEEDGWLNQHIFKVVLREGFVAREFFIWLGDWFIRELQKETHGSTMTHLTNGMFGGFRVDLPPPLEQRAIAAFLERETAKIDALVAKKEQLIELLLAERNALITRAVTNGLNPSVPMKESEVEWLGQVPAHWTVLALSRVTTSRCDGPFGSGLKSEHYSETGIRVVRLQNIEWTEFQDDDRAYIEEDYATELGDHGVVADDLLIAGLGDERHPVGRACVAPVGIEPAMVKADCFRFRLDRRRVVPRFAAYQLSATALAAAGSLATGATRARMNLTATSSRKVALPPLDEQQVIVAELDRGRERHLSRISKIREAIDRLRELRAALISAAVTGKIDVREELA